MDTTDDQSDDHKSLLETLSKRRRRRSRNTPAPEPVVHPVFKEPEPLPEGQPVEHHFKTLGRSPVVPAGALPLALKAHEVFATLVAQGSGRYDAFRRAGYTGDSAAAKRLVDKPDVRARIGFLSEQIKQERVAAQVERLTPMVDALNERTVDKNFLLKELMVNLTLSREAGDIKEANVCIKIMAQMVGLDGETKPKDANRGRPNDDNEDRSGKQISVQILNQITDRLGRSSGDESSEAEADSQESAPSVMGSLSDDRSSRSAVRVDGLAVSDVRPIPVIAPVPRR